MSAGLAGLNQIVLSWSASPGASSYIVERSLDATAWSALAAGVATTSFADSGLSYSTTYFYRTRAVSSFGASTPSLMASAKTQAQPDSLIGHAVSLNVARQKSFTEPVATFADANTATTADHFSAIIRWGDGRTSIGTVSGSDGSFTVMGTHKFATLGVYAIRVIITSNVPDRAQVAVTSSAKVSTLAAIRLSSRAQRAPRVTNKLHRLSRSMFDRAWPISMPEANDLISSPR